MLSSVCPVCFLYKPGPPAKGWRRPQRAELSRPNCSSSSSPTDVPTCQSDAGRVFPVEVPSSQMTPPSVKLTKDGVHVALNSDPQPHPSPLPIFEAYRKILLPFLLYVNDGSLLVSSQIQSRSYKLFLPFLHAEPPEGFPQQQRLTWVGLATLLHYSGHTPAGVPGDSGTGHFARNTHSHSRKHLECVLSSGSGGTPCVAV